MNKKRIIKWQIGEPNGQSQYILYWMQSSNRLVDNHALSLAIALANKHELPLLVYFGLAPTYPKANLRHLYFLYQGLEDVRNLLHERGIRFILRIGSPEKAIYPLLEDAHSLIMDTGYLRHQVVMRRSLVDYCKQNSTHLTIWQVESDVIVPVKIASPKGEYGAYTIRPKIHKLLEVFIDNAPLDPVMKRWEYELPVSDQWDSFDRLLPYLIIDKSCPPSPFFVGGPSKALARLDDFIHQHLHHYLESDDPSHQWTSYLSPYLHFGHISPLTIVKAIRHAVTQGWGTQEAADAFIEQVVVRRELSCNFVTYIEGYDRFDKMSEPWAYQTMRDHLSDPRPYRYIKEDYVHFRTHDAYFNAAMKEMIYTGYMHNYMRMYWAKKIIEWTPSYEEAYETIVYLNDFYFLDGRDPNSYTSIAWVFGKHDRPWMERAIFGKIRYMNDKGLERKFNIQGYVDQISTLDDSISSRK